MQGRRIGPFTVSAVSLGCMNLSRAYGTPPPPGQAQARLLRALDLGVTMFDTAALHGFGANEKLLGRVLGPHRERFVLAGKGGMAGVAGPDGAPRRVTDGRPVAIRRNCEDSLCRLQTDRIDLYFLHRWDKRVPIEDSVGAMADLVRAGKVRAPGRSIRCGAATSRSRCYRPAATSAPRWWPSARRRAANTWWRCRAPSGSRTWKKTSTPMRSCFDAGGLQRLDALINRGSVSGARYSDATQAEIDTEEFG